VPGCTPPSTLGPLGLRLLQLRGYLSARPAAASGDTGEPACTSSPGDSRLRDKHSSKARQAVAVTSDAMACFYVLSSQTGTDSSCQQHMQTHLCLPQ
jgi:hypothetical protein